MFGNIGVSENRLVHRPNKSKQREIKSKHEEALIIRKRKGVKSVILKNQFKVK